MAVKSKKKVVQTTEPDEKASDGSRVLGISISGAPLTEEIMRKGVAASARSKARRRLISESMRDIMAAQVPKNGSYQYIYEKLLEVGLKNPTVSDAIAMGQAIKAIQKMDTDAAKFVRDTSGERPADIKAITISGSLSSDLSALSTEALESRLEQIVESTGVVID